MSIIAFLVKALHFVLCVGLIVIVLLQADKGEGLAGAFGGGASGTIFGERGGDTFMTRLTTIMAVLFMGTSLFISIFLPTLFPDNPSPTVSYTTESSPLSSPGAGGMPESSMPDTTVPVIPDAVPGAVPDVVPNVVPDAAPDTTPDTAPEAVPDVTAPEAVAPAVPDVAPVAPETVPAPGADLTTPEPANPVVPDSAPDTPPTGEN